MGKDPGNDTGLVMHCCGGVHIGLPADSPLVEHAERTTPLLNIPGATVLERTWRWAGPSGCFRLEAWIGGVPRPGEPIIVLEQRTVQAGTLAVRIARCADDAGGAVHHLWFASGEADHHLTAAAVDDAGVTRIAESIRPAG